MNPNELKKIYQFEDYVLNTQNRNFSKHNKLIKLSSRAFDILLYLIQKRGEIVSKDEILQAVWSDSFIEEGNLAVHISALRKIFNERERCEKLIKTVSGRGYSFVAPVTVIDEPAKVFETNLKTKEQYQRISLFKNKVSLAVLPFRHNRTSEDFDYLSSGITQSLIDHLSQLPELKVMSYSSVKAFSNSHEDLQEIGYLLNTEKILIGYISEFKNLFEINIELINADDATQIWGIQYNFQLNDFLRIKNEISKNIAEKLKINLKKAEKVTAILPVQENSKAYKLYLRGKYLLETYQFRNTYREGLDCALDFFRQAIIEDPNYAPIYVGMARVYNNYNVFGFISREEAFNKYRNYIELALKLDPYLSDGYVCKGLLHFFFQTDLLKVEKSLKRAIELNPNNIRAYNFMSTAMVCLSRFSEAQECINRALELDPTSINLNPHLAEILFYTGKYEEAIAQAEESLELNPRSFYALFLLARIYAQLGLFQQSLAYSEKAAEIISSEEIFLLQSYILRLADKPAEAIQLLNKVLTNSTSKNIDFTDVARVYTAFGESEKVFEYLERAFSEGSESIMFLNVDAAFAALREHPKFNDLLAKMNIPRSPVSSE